MISIEVVGITYHFPINLIIYINIEPILNPNEVLVKWTKDFQVYIYIREALIATIRTDNSIVGQLV
ncbi:hypothetical protein D0T85_13140 [Bacteroides sp. 519]|nr:hypothetical protein [Bacteroides sp. 519]